MIRTQVILAKVAHDKPHFLPVKLSSLTQPGSESFIILTRFRQVMCSYMRVSFCIGEYFSTAAQRTVHKQPANLIHAGNIVVFQFLVIATPTIGTALFITDPALVTNPMAANRNFGTLQKINITP